MRRAYAGSDFFRATLAAAGVGADGVDELARLPFTTKEQLRAAYPFGWTCVPDREVVRIHASSGTTGRRTLCTYAATTCRSGRRRSPAASSTRASPTPSACS